MLNNLLAKKKAVRDGALVLLDQGMLAVVNFAVTLFLVRSVSTEKYSAYVLAMSLIMTAMSLHRTLFIIPATVLTPTRAKNTQSDLHGNLLAIAILFSIVISSIFYFVYSRSVPIFNEEGAQYTPLLFSVLILPLLLREQLRATMLAVLAFHRGAIGNFLVSCLALVLIVTTYLKGELTLINLLICLISSHTLGVILLHHLHRKKLSFAKQTLKSDTTEAIETGKWHALNATLYSGTAQSLPWMLAILVDEKAVAVYGVCMSLASLMAPLLRGMNAYLLPRLTHSRNSTDLKRIMMLSIKVLALPYGAWLITVIFMGDFLLTTFFTIEYSGYRLILVLIVLKMAIESVSTPVSTAIQSINAPQIITASLFISLMITIMGGLFLVYTYGLLGAAVIGVIAGSLACIYRTYFLAKKLKHDTSTISNVSQQDS